MGDRSERLDEAGGDESGDEEPEQALNEEEEEGGCAEAAPDGGHRALGGGVVRFDADGAKIGAAFRACHRREAGDAVTTAAAGRISRRLGSLEPAHRHRVGAGL